MARADNIFNVFFVKWSWGWTLTFVSLFVGLTSFTTSCGKTDVIRNQSIRLVIGNSYERILREMSLVKYVPVPK